jgi:putative transposase
MDQRYPNRCHPPHHAPVERFNEPVIVQVNVCTSHRQPVLACEAGHRVCREIWAASDFWRIGDYLIMPDHIHLFCTSGRAPMPSLKHWVEYWKSMIATQWPIIGGPTSASAETDRETEETEPLPPVRIKLWQRDFWDTQMRSREHYQEKLSYVRMNPVRKGLTERPEHWPYCGQIFPVAWM